jgi:pilus assembly protein Flp/PilA
MNYVTSKMVAKMQALWATREQGATAVEYGLLVALIAVIIIVAVTALGGKLSSVFNKTSASLPS